jgi:hypothetical protein
MNDRLKVGLIVDQEDLYKLDYDLVQWANSTHLIWISHLIVQGQSLPLQKRPLIERMLNKNPLDLIRNFLWNTLWTIKECVDARSLAEFPAFRDFAKRLAIGDSVPGRIFVAPQISRSGFVHRFSGGDLQKIRAECFDLLIRAGSGILRGEILRTARLGVLSFHHGDNRVNRGGPAGFWEVYHGEPMTGFVVQRLTEELDGGDVVLRGFVPTQRSHTLNRAMLFAKSYLQLQKLLIRIAEAGELPQLEEHAPYSGSLYGAPGAGQIAWYLGRRAWVSAVSRIRDVRGVKERWGVSYVRSHWRNAAYWRGRPLETRRGHFLADPFIVSREGRSCVFVEDYVYDAKKAHISAFELSEQGASEIGIALEEPFHLSFPFLFEYEGGLFMCPESFQAHEIRIYRCTGFPLRWTLETVAMRGVAAVDTMIFPYEGRWWLFTNLSESEPHLFSTELHIFVAPDPLSGRWVPHRRNPVLMTSDCARNGGLLSDGDQIFRVGQKQGFGSYGASAQVMRILTLDEREYAEEPLCELTPAFRRGLCGSHHLHSDGKYSVWDHKQWDRPF